MKEICEISTANEDKCQAEYIKEDIAMKKMSLKSNSITEGKEKKKKNKKDQNKITSYFTPTRSSISSAVKNQPDPQQSNGNCVTPTKRVQSVSTKENLTNGCSPHFDQLNVCTRSRSQKLSEKIVPSKIFSAESRMVQSPSDEKTMVTSPIHAMISKDSESSVSPSSSLLSLTPTPHKIQALNEEKLRLDSPSTALSKLKILSPAKLKFPQKISKAKRKLAHENIMVDKPKNENEEDEITIDEPAAATVNGSVKGNCKLKMRDTQMTEFFPIRRSHRKPKTTLLQEKQKVINEKIISRREEGLKIQSFGKKGRGIIACQPFKKGEMVVEYIGDLIEMKDAKEREQKYALDSSKGCYMYYFTFQNNQYCIDATEESCFLGRLVNHSRNGNLVTKTVEVKNKPHLILIAKNDIEPGTEILYDYGDRSKQSLENHPWLAL